MGKIIGHPVHFVPSQNDFFLPSVELCPCSKPMDPIDYDWLVGVSPVIEKRTFGKVVISRFSSLVDSPYPREFMLSGARFIRVADRRGNLNVIPRQLPIKES